MLTAPFFLRPESKGCETKPIIRVLMSYQDSVSGQCCGELLRQLEIALGGECMFQTSVWRFGLLRMPKLRKVALDDAIAADLIMIAWHGDSLPARVRSWIRLWGPYKSGQSCALVGLVLETKRRSGESPVLEHLRKVARKGDMEFFWRRAEAAK